MSRGTIALSGYYGFSNAGDEAVLAGLLLALRERSPSGIGLCIDVLSIDPDATRAEHGTTAEHRYRARALVRSIARCRLLASGGGSLLQDVTSPQSIFYYLGVVRAAQILGKRTMFIAQGIGPLLRARSRRLTAAVARRCDAITVRDRASGELLRQIGVDRPKIHVAADPALLLASTSAEARRSGFAFSLRAWRDAPDTLPALVGRACRDALDNAHPASMQMSPDDFEAHRAFVAAFGLGGGTYAGAGGAASPALGWSDAGTVAARAEMVVGMRLHALILAAANGTPSLALSYDPKIQAFMESTGQGDAVVDVRGCDESHLAAAARRIWSERAERAAALQAALPALREAAYSNADVALSLL